jgi:hypothetical protein
MRPGVAPPTAGRVLAVHLVLPARCRLPLLVFVATGMRLGAERERGVVRGRRDRGPRRLSSY